jgi:hypothetical protein
LIQVCATLDDPETLAREVRALEDAIVEFPEAACYLIALDYPNNIQLPAGISLIRASDWLLSDKL